MIQIFLADGQKEGCSTRGPCGPKKCPKQSRQAFTPPPPTPHSSSSSLVLPMYIIHGPHFKGPPYLCHCWEQIKVLTLSTPLPRRGSGACCCTAVGNRWRERPGWQQISLDSCLRAEYLMILNMDLKPWKDHAANRYHWNLAFRLNFEYKTWMADVNIWFWFE